MPRRWIAGVLVLGLWLARGGTVDLLVLQTADIHGAIGTPVLPDEGDWLRLASTIDHLRRAHGAGRTLLIDCGDTCQGSFAARVTNGVVGPALLRQMNVDVWVPGNHDLDFGPARLLEWTRAWQLPTLCGNLVLRLDGQRHSFPPWRRFERDGAVIAVIGATASYLRQWTWGETARQIDVTMAAELLDRVLPEILRSRPDLIVLAAHQGWLESDPRAVNEVHDIALRYPEIDLILGGHTHRPLAGLKIGPATWYVQPGALATHVAAVRVRLDTARHRVLELTSELVPTADRAPVSPGPELVALLATVDAAGAALVCRLQEGVSAGGTPGVSCAASELICRSFAEVTGAAVVLHGTLSRCGLPAGDVSERDLFGLVPYENTIALADLTPAELETVVAEQLTNRASYVYCGLWGLEARIVEGTDGAAATVRLRQPDNGAAPRPERLTVAMNSYTAAGGGGRFPALSEILGRPQTHARNSGIEARDAVRQYLRRHAAEAVTARTWLHGRLAAFDRRGPRAGKP